MKRADRWWNDGRVNGLMWDVSYNIRKDRKLRVPFIFRNRNTPCGRKKGRGRAVHDWSKIKEREREKKKRNVKFWVNCTASVRVSRRRAKKNNSSEEWKWTTKFDLQHSGSQVGWGHRSSHSTRLWPPLEFSAIPLDKTPPKQSFLYRNCSTASVFVSLNDMCYCLHRCCWLLEDRNKS